MWVYVDFDDGAAISVLSLLVTAVNFFIAAHDPMIRSDASMKTPFKIGFLAAALGLIAACAPPGAPYYHTQNGALMGATAGAVIGHQLDHRNGAVAGGLAGALIGGSVGNQMDYQNNYQSDGPYRPYRRLPPRRYYRDNGPPPGYYYDRPPY